MFDPGHNYDDGYEDDGKKFCGIQSLDELQQQALYLFGVYVSRLGGYTCQRPVPETVKKFLPLDEVERILVEHSEQTEHGFILGGSSMEEMRKKMQALMLALLERILSNVLAEGVDQGFLDCYFDGDKNNFNFSVTDLGKSMCENFYDNYRESENGDSGV